MHLSKKIIAVLVFVFLSTTAMATESAAPTEPQTQPAAEQHPFPYAAEVVGNDVYIRSGPGTAYYFCCKLNSPAQVVVVGTTHGGWIEILPPPGSFSLISKTYVSIDATHKNIGVVTGDAVRIWAGSDFVEHMRSSKLQVKLNHGDTVELIGDAAAEDEYYKIVPPAGAHLWVSGEFLRYVGPAPVDEPKAPAAAPAGQTPQPAKETPLPVVVEAPKPAEPAEPAQPTKENFLLKQCQQIAASLDAEVKKPLPQQNYAEYKKAIQELLADPDSAAQKVHPYLVYLQDRISRYEMAISVSSQLQQQDQQLDQAKKDIEQARQARLNQLAPKQEVIMSGTLKPSHVYTGKIGQKRYLLTNDEGKILCYVVLNDPAMQNQFEQLFDTKVGLIGRIINSPNEMVTLVACTDFKPVQSSKKD